MRRILILDNTRSSAEIIGQYLFEKGKADSVDYGTSYAQAIEKLKNSFGYDVVYMTNEIPLRLKVGNLKPRPLIEMLSLERVADRADKKEVIDAFLGFSFGLYDF